jgi:hypothetical protein
MRHRFTRLPALATLVSALSACAGGEGLTPASGPPEKADPVAPEAPSAPVAPPPPEPTYPADHPGMPQIPNNGGAVLHDPVLVTVTFPNDPLKADLEAFGDVIGSLSWWPTVNAEYGVGPATSGGHVVIPDPPPAQMSDADVEAFLQAKITDGTLPAPTDQTIYVLYYPPSTVISLGGGGGDSCGAYLGYHSGISADVGGGHLVPTAYAVVARCGGLDTVTETASHELTEAATDPHPNAQIGYSFIGENAWTLAGGENADMCSMVSGVTEGGYSLTRVWSNRNAKLGDQPCLPLPDPTSPIPYFNAGIVHDVVTAHPGDTVTVEVDCYSFGPLPNAMTLEPHANSPQNIGLTFDDTTCENGDKRTLTIQVASTAKKGTSYHYTLLASIDSSTSHLWRGMVRVY